MTSGTALRKACKQAAQSPDSWVSKYLSENVAPTQRQWVKSLLLCLSMVALFAVTFAFKFVPAILYRTGVRDSIDMAYFNLWDYGIVAAVFLIAPFVGGCSAVRLICSRERHVVIMGGLLLVIFLSLFLVSCLAYCVEYDKFGHSP